MSKFSSIMSNRLLGPLSLAASIDCGLMALLWARTTPVSLYEPDVYSAIPAITWTLFVLGFLMPVILFFLLLATGVENKRFVSYLSAAVVATSMLFQFLPWVRYVSGFDRWDSWYHLAETKQIVATGFPSSGNFYPATHFFTATLSEMTGVAPAIVFGVFPPILSGLLLIAVHFSMGLLGVELKGRFIAIVCAEALLGLPFVLPLSFSLVILAWLCPLVLASIKRSVDGRLSYSVLLLVLISALVISHILTAIAMVVGLAAYLFVSVRSDSSRSRDRRPVNLFAFSSILALAWTFWFTQVYQSPARVIAHIVATGSFTGRNYPAVLEAVGLSGVTALIVVLEILFPRLAALAVAVPAVADGLNSYRRKKASMASYLCGWAVLNLIAFAVLGSLFGSGTIGQLIDRFVYYGLVAVPFLAGLGFAVVFRTSRRRWLPVAAILLLLVGAQVLFYYPAPNTARYNWETGSTDIRGLLWTADNSIPGSSFSGSNYNHAILSGLIGVDPATQIGLTYGMTLPDHLGCLAASGPTSQYTIVTQFDLFVFGRRQEILPSDLACLRSAPTFGQVYDNGAFWLFWNETRNA